MTGYGRRRAGGADALLQHCHQVQRWGALGQLDELTAGDLGIHELTKGTLVGHLTDVDAGELPEEGDVPGEPAPRRRRLRSPLGLTRRGWCGRCRAAVQRSRYTKDSRSPVRVSWRGVSAVRRETVVTLSPLSCRAGPG